MCFPWVAITFEPSSSAYKVREVLGYGLEITSQEKVKTSYTTKRRSQPWPQDHQQQLLRQEDRGLGSVCLGSCPLGSELCVERVGTIESPPTSEGTERGQPVSCPSGPRNTLILRLLFL